MHRLPILILCKKSATSQTVQHSKCSTHTSPLEHAYNLPCLHRISFVCGVLAAHVIAMAFSAQHALLHVHVHKSHGCDLSLTWV